jgi:hypothetical protein
VIHPKSGFILISFFYADIVKSPMDIEFDKVLGPLEFIDEFRNEGKEVFVLHSDHI